MLTTFLVEQILGQIPRLTIGLVGDLFLDRYLDLAGELTEPSLETGLDAYQVVGVRSYPGALGTIINNLAALGVGKILPVTAIGDDGEGYELRQALSALPGVNQECIATWNNRRTPTYTKPMLKHPGQPAEELNRLDIKNRKPTPSEIQEIIIRHLDQHWNSCDVWLVLDQVSEVNCGIITDHVRDWLSEKGKTNPEKFVLCDSRERIATFRNLSLKPNAVEWFSLLPQDATPDTRASYGVKRAQEIGGSIFCTQGESGIHLYQPDEETPRVIPAYPVSGPIDIVGAGDSCSAGIACAMGSGTSQEQAAAFGNLVASITIQQIGTTGTATPKQVRQRWSEIETTSGERGT